MLASLAAAVLLLASGAQGQSTSSATPDNATYQVYFSFAGNPATTLPPKVPIKLRLGDGDAGAMMDTVLNPLPLAPDRTMGFELRLSEPFARDICQVAVLFRPKGIW